MKYKGIFWLASYPKSGNTWFRIFLQNLLTDPKKPIFINDLSIGEIGSSRHWLDDVSGFDSSDLYQWEIDNLRPLIYDWTAENSYHKIHDACWQLNSGQWLVSAEATVGALYFLRNPLDVAISYANHFQCSIDKTIDLMAKPEHCFYKNKHRSFNDQTEQRMLTWSQHVISWVDNPITNTHVMRYEDMKLEPQKTFTKAVSYLRLPTEHEKIAKALKSSDFKIVQQQEVEFKFRERPPTIERFFRKGIAGDWQETLTTKQIGRIINDHHEVMLRFNYLDKAGNPQIM